MKQVLQLLLAALLPMGFFIAGTTAQTLPDSTIRNIDRLFDKWNKNDAPGCVAGIIMGNQLVYAKGFGLANLESKAPNTPESIYYMCSVSKQFAGYAITLLARQGKVKLDDDIHVYLPWMGDLGETITIRHLLNHTSGIRDDISLASIGGLGGNGMITQQLAVNILQRQRTLNFKPGEKYAYSNSNYVLLAAIVEQASKQGFRSFTDSAIFKPLGMSSSRFISIPEELIPNRAASYSANNGQFSNSYQNVYTLGDGGLFTNIRDMAKWVMNFYTPVAGDLKDIAQLTEQGKLNDGTTINYALGISVDVNRGHKRLLHNGGLAGYRTIIIVYPELQMGFLVFGNTGEGEIYNKANQLESLLVPEKTAPVANATVNTTPPSTMTIDSLLLKKWEGNYISENGFRINIARRKDSLFANTALFMAPESANSFHLARQPAVRYTFSEGSLRFVSPALSKPMLLTYTAAQPVTEALLDTYTGTYYSTEMDCYFRIVRKGQVLWMTSSRNNDARINLIGTDHLYTEYDFLNHLLIKRDGKNRITGFELNSGSILHLFFRKTE